jgi:hypothetical protein
LNGDRAILRGARRGWPPAPIPNGPSVPTGDSAYGDSCGTRSDANDSASVLKRNKLRGGEALCEYRLTPAAPFSEPYKPNPPGPGVLLGDKPVADALASPKSSLRSKLEYAADVSYDFLVCSTHGKSFKARRRSRQRVVDGKPVASRGDVFAAFRIFSEKTEKTRCSLRSRSERRAVGTGRRRGTAPAEGVVARRRVRDAGARARRNFGGAVPLARTTGARRSRAAPPRPVS